VHSSRLLVALLLVAGIVAGATAQDKATLKWKFEPKKSFYQKMTTDTKQNMKVMGSDVVQNQSQTFFFSWMVDKVEPDGSALITQKIEGVKMSIDIGGSKIEYDSTRDTNTANPLSDFFKALVGSEFKLTVDKDLKVTKIDGRTEFIKKLTGANPQMEPLLTQILSEQAMKEMAEPTFASIPTAEIKKGQDWTKSTKLEMGPIGSYDNTFKYTYEGKDGPLDKVKVDTTLKYTPPKESGTSPLPFKIKGADLKSTNATGVILFDNTKGRVEKSDMKLELKGKLQIEIGGTTTDVELSQTQTTNVETSDTNYVTKK
jgi:hypothetical protein